MDLSLEADMRAHAARLKTIGTPNWDYRLRLNGLDPARWSDGGIDTRFVAQATRDLASGELLHRSAPLAAQSYDEAENSIECTWTTGASVLRSTYAGESYSEELDVTAKAVRLDRLNAGAPFLNSHQSGALGMVLGAVVPKSARIVGGKGLCRIALSKSPENAGLVADIRGGVIRNVSVGYLIHAVAWTEGTRGAVPVCRVTDWEPIEVSAVAIPADPAAQIRSDDSFADAEAAGARMRMAARAAGVEN